MEKFFKIHGRMITWTTIQFWYPNRAHSPWIMNTVIHWWSPHPGTIMDTWCSGTAWGRPWCSCSTLRPRPHSSPQDCAPSPDVSNSYTKLSLGQVHFWHNSIELAGLLLTCLRWVSLPCWWFCNTAICNMKVRTWTVIRRKSKSFTRLPRFSFSHQSFIDILEGDHNPSSWLVEVDHLKLWM